MVGIDRGPGLGTMIAGGAIGILLYLGFIALVVFVIIKVAMWALGMG